MTKTEFPLTLLMQNQEDKSLDQWKISVWGLLVIQYQILQTNIIGIVWQTVRRIANEILGVKGLTTGYHHWGAVAIYLLTS